MAKWIKIKENKVKVVICSDLMARGIDFSDVSDVLSIDVPKDRSFFFHRVGRTARFDKNGNAYLFFNVEGIKEVEELQKLGAKFKFMSLQPEGLKAKRETPQYLNKKKKGDDELKRAISAEMRKVKTTEKKPNYKKKQKLAREKAIKKYNKAQLRKKIREQRYGRKANNER